MALILVRRWNQLKLALGKADRNAFYDAQEILRRHLREDSVCVDVGCHSGVILRMMIRFTPKGKFYAFELLPHLYRGLVEAFRGQNVRLYDVALSDAPLYLLVAGARNHLQANRSLARGRPPHRSGM